MKTNTCVSEDKSEDDDFACYRCETKADEDVCEEIDDKCAYKKCAKVIDLLILYILLHFVTRVSSSESIEQYLISKCYNETSV